MKASYIKPCRLDSPDFTECAIKHGNDAIATLLKGDRAYGIPSFTPFIIPLVTISANGLDMNLTQATFSGIENLKLTKYILDLKNKKVNITMTNPFLNFEFDYKTRGKVAALPIEGDGHGWTKFYNGNYSYDYDFDVMERKGKHYMHIVKNKIKIEPERLEANIDNLFNGNKQLGDHLNNFFNENWRELLVQFGPVLSEVYGSVGKQILAKIYDRIPLEEIYPGIVL
ncbi:protein takeout-like isoform X2 [Harmonia axyridis]|uniref:protein takeout-like isoform X2 n=1 Tax=Harmonia axyridis TaxID=115357 RepID=UPI001E277650|nr:protein takeout-like isoform X2 [Harmonia axyridis]